MKIYPITIFFILLSFALAFGQVEPPNAEAEVSVLGNEITILYYGKTIFYGNIFSENPVKIIQSAAENKEAVNQVLTIQGKGIEIKGTIKGSSEAFPCESDRNFRNEYDFVRHSVGLSHSLLNRAVYDRKFDWVLSVDNQGSEARISPLDKGTFGISIQGNEITIRFRPRFYQKYRQLAYYKPWEYKPKKPIVGWCSWFAFWNRVTENDIYKTADVLSVKLVPYGLKYLQIDDGYQQEPAGMPETWLKPNNKFPNGMDGLAEYISKKGMLPGVWTYASFQDKKAVQENAQFFVKDKDGNLATGKWINYCIDASNPDAIDKLVRPTYKGFKEMGWKYFKVDALRHLRYDGYNSHPEYFKQKGVARVDAFRSFVQSVREEIGDDNYMLACWGVRPELIGIADACRIGTDGYGLGALSQYNSFNNVVWQNDPDHIEAFGDFAYRDCMATSLTGSLYMITDKPEDYESGNLEPIIRTIPVLYTRPGQLYDVDPTRSMYLGDVESEVSGSGERHFDGGRHSFNDLFLLEINKPYENWMVLGRTGNRIETIEFSRLGLNKEESYFVFDFWHKKLLGSFSRSFSPGKIDSTYKCQAFCIRKEKEHPQLIATNRHITCGALELEKVSWNNNQLSGASTLIKKDKYILYVTEPEGYTFLNIECNSGEEVESLVNGNLREIYIVSPSDKTVNWKINYRTTLK